MSTRDYWDHGPDSEGYDVGQACLNGHSITGSLRLCPDLAKQFCGQCGEPTITKCQNSDCGAAIHGNLRESFGSWEPDKYCHECGKPYPWTERRTETLRDAIDELEQLQDAEREKLKQSIPDVLNETVKTETAVIKFGKAIRNAGKVGGKLLENVLAKVAAEVVVQQLGLKPSQN